MEIFQVDKSIKQQVSQSPTDQCEVQPQTNTQQEFPSTQPQIDIIALNYLSYSQQNEQYYVKTQISFYETNTIYQMHTFQFNHEQKFSEIQNLALEHMAVVTNVGEIFYLRRKIPNTKNMFKGYSEFLNKKVVGVMLKKRTQNYNQLQVANYFIQQYQVNQFFNVEMYQIPCEHVKSQYCMRELDENFDEQLSIYSIQTYFKGSLEDLIFSRKKKQMNFSPDELDGIFQRLLQIGSCLENLCLYHQNLKPSKILLHFNRKSLKFEKQSLVLSSLQEIYKFNFKSDEFFDTNNYDLEELFNFNGYTTPEIADFESQIRIFKQNSFAIGLFMLNLLILDVFSISRFYNSYQKGINLLQNECKSDTVRKGVSLLLQQDQQLRYTCQEVLKEIYNESFKLTSLQKYQNQPQLTFDKFYGYENQNFTNEQKDIHNNQLEKQYDFDVCQSNSDSLKSDYSEEDVSKITSTCQDIDQQPAFDQKKQIKSLKKY
ncbi:hypothetical protein ABPG72_013423 [Tetrahymena utriculariae]